MTKLEEILTDVRQGTSDVNEAATAIRTLFSAEKIDLGNDLVVAYEKTMHLPKSSGGKGYQEQGWRDIESAPKDGTRFLFTNGKIVGTGFYIQEQHFATDSWQGETNTTVTHWISLPPPPQENKL